MNGAWRNIWKTSRYNTVSKSIKIKFNIIAFLKHGTSNNKINYLRQELQCTAAGMTEIFYSMLNTWHKVNSCHCDLCCDSVKPILHQRRQHEVFPKLSLTIYLNTQSREHKLNSKLPWKPQISNQPTNQRNNQPAKKQTNQPYNQTTNQPTIQPTNQTASSISRSSWNTSNFVMLPLTSSSYVITPGQYSILTLVWTNSCKCKWKQ